MLLKELNQNAVSKLISQQIYHVTCMECCKYYIVPETASCGHTLCHGCWSGRRTCPVCASPLNKKTLKQNIPLQSLIEHTNALSDAFEKLFGVKLAEMELEPDKENDPIKNVKEWLASSQNHFSAPVTSSQQSTIDDCAPKPIELSASKIQIHSHNTSMTKTKDIIAPKEQSLSKTIPSIPSQNDWDKIEVLPDSEEQNKNKENTTGSKEKQMPFIFVDENAYSTENPRRSSRKRECKLEDEEKCNGSGDKSSSKKTIQNWSNVKKMRKEFSKLNKKDRNKLNVSIEMCKKAQNNIKKDLPLLPLQVPPNKEIMNEVLNEIEDQTPNEAPQSDQIAKPLDKGLTDISFDIDIQNAERNENQEMDISNLNENNKSPDKKSTATKPVKNSINNTESNTTAINVDSSTNKMVFIKKSSLCQNTTDPENIKITQKKLDTNSVTMNTDDIEISIKIGSTVTNILIKKKACDVEMKVKTDREIQTSLGPYTLTQKDAACSPIKSTSKKCETQKTSESIKKNTASAETTSARFEITESVEKELSNLMEYEETVPKAIKPKKFTTMSVKKSIIEQPIAAPLKATQIDQATQSKKVIISQISSNAQDQSDNSNLKTNDKNLRINTFYENIDQVQNKLRTSTNPDKVQPQPQPDDDMDNDADMFGSGSVRETNVHLLKDSEPVASEIFMPTIKTGKTQNMEKRGREDEEIEMPHKKKQKVDTKKDKNTQIDQSLQEKDKLGINESENMNYDVIMSQVFASIDADIKSQKKTQSKKDSNSKATDNIAHIQKNQPSQANHNLKEDQKYSENVFSFLEKDSELAEAIKGNQVAGPETQDNIQKLLTPGMLRDLATANVDAEINDIEMQDTPMEADESDKSVVEETPQKNVSFTNLKQKTEVSNKNATNEKSTEVKKVLQEKNTQDLRENDSQIIKSIINISDTLPDSNKINVSIAENNAKQSLKLETPVTINKFVNHIQYKSTPVARKSLNFDVSENVDNEQTLCPSTTQEKPSQPITICPTTTQEREFLAKAFEQSPSPIKMPVKQRTPQIKKNKKLCLAGSCLSPNELGNLKKLCATHGWTFVDKYTKELTHLVVGVDEENRSQRSVKFMCALAASKWIVSYSWVEKCLKAACAVDEEAYEALDATGDPGPRLSRISTRKLFEGYTFFCMPPFSILDIGSLKYMLEAAGGSVVSDPRLVKVTPGRPPAILLAEPEHTQEDKFIYLAMELCIVPVNYEWVLNCLGSYCISSFYDLLLCPSTLLPPACNAWPPELLARDKDDV